MHQNHLDSKTLVCGDDLPHKKWYKHLSYLFRFRLQKGSKCMLVSMCYLHWQTKKTVLKVSLERNKTDSKGETHLKPHPALWFHLWVKQPLPVCLFCCVFPSKHCHESLPSFSSSSLPFPSLPSSSFFPNRPLLLDLHVAHLLSSCQNLLRPRQRDKGKDAGVFPWQARPARRPAEKGSLTVPGESSTSSLPLCPPARNKDHAAGQKQRSALFLLGFLNTLPFPPRPSPLLLVLLGSVCKQIQAHVIRYLHHSSTFTAPSFLFYPSHPDRALSWLLTSPSHNHPAAAAFAQTRWQIEVGERHWYDINKVYFIA